MLRRLRLPRHAFKTSEALLEELTRSQREQQIWVIGSGLTVPVREDGAESPTRGVPGTAGMIDILREQLRREKGESAVRDLDHEIHESQRAEAVEEEDNIEEEDSAEERRQRKEYIAPYQVAFRFAAESKRLGDRALNRIVRSAVLEAYTGELGESQKKRIEKGEIWDCSEIEKQSEKWSLRPGICNIGKIVTHTETKHTILTTNFDPLIEIAIRRASGRPVTMLMASDDVLSYTLTDHPRIAHLHGYWFGSGLLHTNSQLLEERPRLKSSIAGMLKDQDIFVFGYGGWKDVMRDALYDALADATNYTSVHWCFIEPREQVEAKYKRLLDTFRPYIEGARFTLYPGINPDKILPLACDRLDNEEIRTLVVLERQIDRLTDDKSGLEKAITEREQQLEIFQDLDIRRTQINEAITEASNLVESLHGLGIKLDNSLQQWLAAHESNVQRLGGLGKDIQGVFDEGERRVHVLVERLKGVLQDSSTLEETKREIEVLKAELSTIKKQTRPSRVALSLFMLQGIVVLLIIAGWVIVHQ